MRLKNCQTACKNRSLRTPKIAKNQPTFAAILPHNVQIGNIVETEDIAASKEHIHKGFDGAHSMALYYWNEFVEEPIINTVDDGSDFLSLPSSSAVEPKSMVSCEDEAQIIQGTPEPTNEDILLAADSMVDTDSAADEAVRQAVNWGVVEETEDKPRTYRENVAYFATDAGSVDNGGLIGTLLKGKRRIICYMSSSCPIAGRNWLRAPLYKENIRMSDDGVLEYEDNQKSPLCHDEHQKKQAAQRKKFSMDNMSCSSSTNDLLGRTNSNSSNLPKINEEEEVSSLTPKKNNKGVPLSPPKNFFCKKGLEDDDHASIHVEVLSDFENYNNESKKHDCTMPMILSVKYGVFLASLKSIFTCCLQFGNANLRAKDRF